MTKRLLVADDSITIQKVVGLAFAQENVTIDAVGRGDEALERARLVRPDIILADVFMPGLNGYAVCESVKTDPDLKHIPVILMVGSFEPFDSEEAQRVQFDACLTKPFDTNELVQTVRSLTLQAPGQKAQPRVPETTPEAPAAVLTGPLATERSRASFLGTQPILDVFGPLNLGGCTEKAAFPHEMLRSIVENIVGRVVPDIVREVAWEVVPELSEMLIRKKISEGGSELPR